MMSYRRHPAERLTTEQKQRFLCDVVGLLLAKRILFAFKLQFLVQDAVMFGQGVPALA